MPRSCDICCHPRRLDAERRSASGEAVLAVAKHLGMSRDALRRHMRNHVAPTMRAVSMARAAAEGQAVVILPPAKKNGPPKHIVPNLPTLESVATDLQALKVRAAKILDDAEEAGTVPGRVAATGALVAVLDRLGKVAQLLAPPAPAPPPADTGTEIAAVILSELAALNPDMARRLADRLSAYLDADLPDAA